MEIADGQILDQRIGEPLPFHCLRDCAEFLGLAQKGVHQIEHLAHIVVRNE
jgi:hypothetical protein